MNLTLLEIAVPLLKALSAKLAELFTRKPIGQEEALKTLVGLLSGRLVYLLRYMETYQNPDLPASFGRVLSAFVEVGKTRQPARYSSESEPAWEKASQYACMFLSMLGLVELTGAIGHEVLISDLGKTVIRSELTKTRFSDVFRQQLP